MPKYTILDMAEEVLKASSTPLDVNSIWQSAVRSKLPEKLVSQGKTLWNSLGSRLYVDTKENSKSKFFRVGQGPVQFGLKGIHQELEVAALPLIQTLESESKFTEKSLHPLLAFFARLYMREVYTKTILHEKSTKNGLNKWAHPDVVGVRFAELTEPALQLASSLGELPVVFFSFELKRWLNHGNLQASFFQAVSNSSWAHQGYLVAAQINEDQDFRGELERLSATFGIGVIALDIDSPDDSDILFPARRRETLDWSMIDKLAAANDDFRQFLKDVRIDIEGRKVHPAEYDMFEQDIDKLKSLMQAFNKP